MCGLVWRSVVGVAWCGAVSIVWWDQWGDGSVVVGEVKQERIGMENEE